MKHHSFEIFTKKIKKSSLDLLQLLERQLGHSRLRRSDSDEVPLEEEEEVVVRVEEGAVVVQQAAEGGKGGGGGGRGGGPLDLEMKFRD